MRTAISNISRRSAIRRPGKPIGATDDNLKAAIAGETHEYTDMYPGMARTAREEGFDEIADWFETLAKAEKSHAGRFQKALDALESKRPYAELNEAAQAPLGARSVVARAGPLQASPTRQDDRCEKAASTRRRATRSPGRTRISTTARRSKPRCERVFDICHGCRRCFNLCDSAFRGSST